MENVIMKKDSSEVIELCNRYGIHIYTEESYRALLRSVKRKKNEDIEYQLAVNKLMIPVWKESELDFSSTEPEHHRGIIYGIFSEKNLMVKSNNTLNKLVLFNKTFIVNFAYLGYEIDVRRPLQHIDKYGDSIFDYMKSIKEKTNDNIYIVILAKGLPESYAKDGEAILQRIFKYLQLPGNEVGEDYGCLKNQKCQKPSSLRLFNKFEDSRKYNSLFDGVNSYRPSKGEGDDNKEQKL